MFQFKNLKELFSALPDEESCRAYMEKQRWDNKPICPFCGHDKVYRIESNKRFKCANNKCYKKFSVTVGTVMENSNIPLTTWFPAVYLATAHKKGISSCQLARDLGITQRTAWFMLHRIRETFKNSAPELLENIVEVDESFIGGRNKNRHSDKKVPKSQGRSFKDKTPVLGMMQSLGKTSKVKTVVVENTQAETLLPIINDNIKKDGTVVVSDEWIAYADLGQQHPHVAINHSAKEYMRGAFHINNIENHWSLFKRGYIGIYHKMSRKHLQKYCDEFSYRYNTRDLKDNERFNLSLTKLNGRLKYADLVSNKKQDASA